jgi:hypothetical protein
MAFPLDFPLNPSVDDIYPGDNGVNYQWDGFKWTTRLSSRNSSLGGNPGSNAPIGAVVGDFWFQTPENQLWIALPDVTNTTIEWIKTSLKDSPYANPLP